MHHMMQQLTTHRRAVAGGVFAFFVLAFGGCGGDDRMAPSAATPADLAPEAAVSALPGIVFASSGLTASQLTSVHTGLVRKATPSELLSFLSQVKSKGGRVVLVLAGDGAPRNTDGTFNLSKWQTAVSRFKAINFGSYITDGTIVGHFLIDEPHFPSRWGGKVIPQATVEAAAKYSKQIWPQMPTLVAAPASWLASASITYTYLDAGWATYRSSNGTASTWITNQANKAKQKGLGLVVGLNVLDGGNGSSGIRGYTAGKWAMSASEIRSYGSALLAQSYVCGFYNWTYNSTYYGRSDIKSAMLDVSTTARNHTRTSCRQ
jgi:hypothetical protein